MDIEKVCRAYTEAQVENVCTIGGDAARIIRKIVGKQNVEATSQDCLVAVRRKLDKGAWDALKPAEQAALAFFVARTHRQNQRLFYAVAKGEALRPDKTVGQ